MNSPRWKLATAASLMLIALILNSTLLMAGDDEKVVFNTQSHKYHCSTCRYAVRCTKNCVTITKAEAIKRSGLPCKACGGACKMGTSSSPGTQVDQLAHTSS